VSSAKAFKLTLLPFSLYINSSETSLLLCDAIIVGLGSINIFFKYYEKMVAADESQIH